MSGQISEVSSTPHECWTSCSPNRLQGTETLSKTSEIFFSQSAGWISEVSSTPHECWISCSPNWLWETESLSKTSEISLLATASHHGVGHLGHAYHLAHVVHPHDVGSAGDSQSDSGGRSLETFLRRKIESVSNE